MHSKRIFDIFCALGLLLLLGWVIVIGWFMSAVDTKTNGLFLQLRIGRHGKPFKIYKLRTINPVTGKISSTGKFLRNYKIDEFPQFINVLAGDMSMVGPRPDLPGYYNNLQGEDREVLSLRPGITGPATLKYAKEEELLSRQENAENYNNTVIFLIKLKLTRVIFKHRSLYLDLKIILYTVLGKKMEEDYFN